MSMGKLSGVLSIDYPEPSKRDEVYFAGVVVGRVCDVFRASVPLCHAVVIELGVNKEGKDLSLLIRDRVQHLWYCVNSGVALELTMKKEKLTLAAIPVKSESRRSQGQTGSQEVHESG